MGRLAVKIRLILMPILFFVAILILWEFAVDAFNIQSFVLPKPSAIGAILVRKGDMYVTHTIVTLREALGGLAIGTMASVGAAVGVFSFKPLRETLYPILVSLNTLPKSAVAPLLIIWFGAGTFSTLLVVILITFFPILINTLAGLEAIEPELVELASSLKATRTQILSKIRLPASLPYFFAGFKVALTLSFIGAVIGEYVGSDMGLGYLTIISLAQMNTEQIFGTLAILASMGLAFYGLVELLDRKVIYWRTK